MGNQNDLASLYKPLCDVEAAYRTLGVEESAEKAMKGLSTPFLINISAEYTQSHPRVVIVGQETMGWGWGADSHLTYQDFVKHKTLDAAQLLYDGYLKSPVMTPFFQYLNKIQRGIFGDEETVPGQILWLNLFKFNHEPDHCYMIYSPYCDAALNLQRDVFQQEIKLLEPAVVVFLTGPYYDKIIQHFYPDVVFQPVENSNTRLFARLSDRQLPKLSFRTYHPGYLNRRKKMADSIVATIIQSVRREFGTA